MAKAIKSYLKSRPKGGLTLAEMYSFPQIYGAAPSSLKWSSGNETLAFLWNEAGELRRDIYVSRPGTRPVRLTDSARVGPLPVEDDERPREDVEYAELMYSGVSEYDWAPDGSWIAYVCRGDLFRIAASGGEPVRLTQMTQGVSGVQVSLDGRRIGFKMGANVWAYDVERGSLTQLTCFQKEEVAVQRYLWSPDSTWLAVYVEDRSMFEKVKMPDYSPEKEVKVKELRRGNVGKPLSKVRVGFVPAAGGKMVRAALPAPGEETNADKTKKGKADEIDTGNSIRVHDASWTWDSSKLLVGTVGKDYKDYHLFAVSPDDAGAPVELYTEVQEPWFCRCAVESSPDSKYAYFASYTSGWKHLYRVPTAGGKAEQITKGDFDVTGYTVPKKGDRLFYTANAPHPSEQRVFSMPLAGGKATEVSPDLPACQVFPSDDGSALAFVASGIMVPPEIYRPSDGGEVVRVTTSPRPEFEKIVKPKVDRFTFTNESDGETIHARMMFPRNFDPSKKYPAVLTCVYAGGAKEGFGRYQVLDTYMANEMGYILVSIDLRASTGHGRDFFYGYHKKMGIIDAEECVSCATHLRTLPYVDGERLGIWGGSYGGFLVLMVMCRHPGVFHTGISWKPVTDWRNYWDGYVAERLTRPEDAPEVYEATSPVFHAAGLEGNLLLVHGMQDDNVLFQDAVWMVQKLVEAGKYFDLMIYPKDDHMLALRRESLPDCIERFAAYFEEHMGLGPVE